MSLLLLLRPSKSSGEEGGHFYPGDPNPFILKDIAPEPDPQPSTPEETVEEFLSYQELPSVETHLSEYDKETQELLLRKARKRAAAEQELLDDLADEISILERHILYAIQEFEEEAVIMLLLSDL